MLVQAKHLGCVWNIHIMKICSSTHQMHFACNVPCPLYCKWFTCHTCHLSAPSSITSSSPRTTRLVTILWWKPARCNGARCLWNIGIERWFLLLAAWYIGLKSLTLLASDKQLDLWQCAGKVPGSDHLHWHRISAWSVWTVDTPWRLETLTLPAWYCHKRFQKQCCSTERYCLNRKGVFELS